MKKLLILLLGLSFIPIKVIQAQNFNYKINSMYIYYFSKYIDWPGKVSDQTIKIGIIGNSLLVEELKKLTANKKVNNCSIIVEAISIAESKKCNIVILSKNNSAKIKELMMQLGDDPVLVVSEKEGFTAKGADICIYVDDEDNFKTKFELSKTKMAKSGFKVSHELIGLASIVE